MRNSLTMAAAGLILASVFGMKAEATKCDDPNPLEGLVCDYADIDDLGHVKLRSFRPDLASYSGIFDITADGIEGDTITIGSPYLRPAMTFSDIGGFTPGFDVATCAKIFFLVRDDGCDNSEKISVTIEGDLLGSPIEVDTEILMFGANAHIFASLNDNGQLAYTLTATRGDFYIDYGLLCVRANPGKKDVPDGGATAILLGAALVGMGIARRKS